MKELLLNIIMVLFFAIASQAQSDCARTTLGSTVMLTNPLTCPQGNLMLVFDDEFDGNKLDDTRWYKRTRVARDYDFVHSKQFYQEENVVVENGQMKIFAKRENLIDMAYGDNGERRSDFSFTSGEINTLFEFGYGIYEIKCKLPQGATKGFFPAFWGFSDASHIWHEIDVFEAWSSHNKQHDYALKEVGMTSFREIGDDVFRCTTSFKNNTDFGSGFHTFRVLYRPDYIEWSIDGTVRRRTYRYYTLLGQPVDCAHTNTYTTYVHNRSMPYEPMNIKIDLAIENGLDSDGESRRPNSATRLPNTFEVEYVKIWQYLPCHGDIVVTNQAEFDALLANQPEYYNAIFASSISIDNAVLKSDQSLVLISSGDIVLGQDFNTQTGSFLDIQELENDPCSTTGIIPDDHNPVDHHIDLAARNIEEAYSLSEKKAYKPISFTPQDEGGVQGYALMEKEPLGGQQFQLQISNTLGQVVYSEMIELTEPHTLERSIFKDKGVHVVTLVSENGLIVQKEKVLIL